MEQNNNGQSINPTDGEKKKYYVSVQADTVLPNKGDAAFEFEIEATEEDVNKLQELFENKVDSAESTFLKAHLPTIPYHFDVENDAYDQDLKQIYQFLHQLGTTETKQHIESMHILDDSTGYNTE